MRFQDIYGSYCSQRNLFLGFLSFILSFFFQVLLLNIWYEGQTFYSYEITLDVCERTHLYHLKILCTYFMFYLQLGRRQKQDKILCLPIFKIISLQELGLQ